MKDIVISVENLGKMYRISRTGQGYQTLRDKILSVSSIFKRSSNKREDFWALKDVSFEIEAGDRIGIIGRNGAGKSTLLKLLSRIIKPTHGKAIINGRVASLLEVGTGFHPELTGRENIFMNGAILGMMRAEIKRKFDEIVDFAEVEKFIDTPVKRYSSGMYVRLAFAVAAHLEPEILLVDEVLAVGDAQFQKKCLGKMESVAKNEGRTILFVSHNMAAIQQLCTKGILLSKGMVAFNGTANEVVNQYLNTNIVHESSTEDGFLELSQAREKVYKDTVFKKIRILNKNGKPCRTFPMLDPMRIEVELEGTEKFPNADYGVFIDTLIGQRITSYLPSWMIPHYEFVTPKTIMVDIPSVRINAGSYIVGLSAAFCSTGEFIDLVDHAIGFDIESIDLFGTGKAFPANWGIILPECTFTIR